MNQQCTDLSKIGHADFHWQNNFGQTARTKPKHPTYMLRPITDDVIHGSSETLRQRSERLGLLDTWEPVVILHASCRQRYRYTGKRALSLWKTFCAKQYKRKGKSNE